MRIKDFSLYLKTKSGVISYSEGKNDNFTFSISEQKNDGNTIIVGKLTAHTKLELFWLDVMIPEQLDELSYYANGFQSWSTSPFIDKNKKIKKLAGLAGEMFRLKNYGDYNFNKMALKSGPAYSHLYLDLIKDKETRIFYGDLKPYDSYTTFAVNYSSDIITVGNDLDGLTMQSGEFMDIFNICIVHDSDTWFNLLNIERLPADKFTGWTSWYNYYTRITEYILEANMKSLAKAEIQMDVFQIDDGYFTHIGDWLEPNDRFPGGMKAIADKIKKHGWNAGLWSAPFVTDSKSEIFKNHSNWILRTSDGKLQIAGWNPNWAGMFYALDIYNEEFREYLKEVYDTTVNKWGYDLLKLDFLYAAALQPREGKTRCMIMTDAMDFLLELTDGAKILACGIPIAPAIGKCHYCRIGGDISHMWEDKLLKRINYRERVSTAASLSNTESRYFLNEKAFLNDPDVFILRDSKEIKMSEEEKNILFNTNVTKAGLVFFSDDISMYEEEKVSKVKEAFQTFHKE